MIKVYFAKNGISKVALLPVVMKVLAQPEAASGDEKAVSSAWAQIYWGLIGLVVVVGAFAIINLAETFFNIQIISGGFSLPR